MHNRKTVLEPDRLRHIERPFAWLPCRLLTEGWLRRLCPSATQLYLLLALAADRQGLSCFGDQRAAAELGIRPDDLHPARAQLVNLGLIAYDGHTYQLLPLPEKTGQPRSSPPPQPRQPAPRQVQTSAPFHLPQHIKTALRSILGDDPK